MKARAEGLHSVSGAPQLPHERRLGSKVQEMQYDREVIAASEKLQFVYTKHR
jgi:hypothetical protein